MAASYFKLIVGRRLIAAGEANHSASSNLLVVAIHLIRVMLSQPGAWDASAIGAPKAVTLLRAAEAPKLRPGFERWYR
jgi:hypothetical protein